ncbi:MAG: ABC transporter permease subunit [Bacteroidales bacterium]|nr:ABC transporter permease subunit [Bacteroidales bacterium]
MNPGNILNVAIYERKTLFRSWFFRIFSILSLLILFGINIGMFGGHSGARWSTRAIAANLPYINVLFINVAQAVIAVFLASDFLRRDKKLDTTEVIYARPITNGEYVVGKTLGILILFVGLVIMALAMSLVFNLIRQDVPIVWEAYLYYPLLISVPTLIYILGLSFFMMILFRSQAVTFLVLLGYIGLTLFYFQDKLFGLLDYMAFNLPMVYSDFIQFAEPERILQHRLAYLLMGIGFIFATIRFLNRLPQTGRWNNINLVAFIAFTMLGGSLGFRYYLGHQDLATGREHYLELNNRYADRAVVDIISNDLHVVQQGSKLTISSEIRLRNQNRQSIDTLIFSLNPGFSIDSITDRTGAVNFIRRDQIIQIIPDNGIAPGNRGRLSFYYSGIPDESVTYLDIPAEQLESLKRIQVATVDKKPGIINSNYLLLTPELLWYPMAGVGFNMITFQPRELDFVRFSLTVVPHKKLTAIAPGKAEYLDDQVQFIPETDLNALALVIGPFEKRSMEIEGVEYNLFIKPDHDYFSGFLSNITDTLDILINEAKDNYEIDELDLYYPFRRINLVEVPIQYHAYERPYIQTIEHILPEMILLPEKGAGINTLDFARMKKAEERRDRQRDNQRSPREMETDQFKRFLQNTFFRSGTRTRPMRPGQGPQGGEDLITFQGSSNYTKNPYCVFPLYYSYVTGISSKEYPIFNSMMELYLKEGFEVSPRQGFTGGITDNERANLALQERSMIDIFARWNTELTSSLINQTGSFIILALKNRVGMVDFDYFLYYYLEDHAFSEISFEQFAGDFRDEFDVEIEPYLDIINSGGNMATFLISTPEFIQTRDEIGDVFLVRFKITNTGAAKGMVDVTFRIMGQGGFGGGGSGMSTEQRLYEVDEGTTREVQVVLYDQPRMMTVNTLISGNIPSSFNIFLRSASTEKGAGLTEYDRISETPVHFKYDGEYIVDNEDDGFSHVSVSRESKLKQYIDSRKKLDNEISYGSINPYWSPAKWTPVAHSAYYGENIRSALITRKGDGGNRARWATLLPEAGFYDVYVYIPVSAMYRRPSGRQHGGEGRGQGQGNRPRGPEFADKGTDYHYTISSNEGTEEVVYILDNPEEGWNRLGSFHFPADSAIIELSNRTGGNRVIADAVKWVRRPG